MRVCRLVCTADTVWCCWDNDADCSLILAWYLLNLYYFLAPLSKEDIAIFRRELAAMGEQFQIIKSGMNVLQSLLIEIVKDVKSVKLSLAEMTRACKYYIYSQFIIFLLIIFSFWTAPEEEEVEDREASPMKGGEKEKAASIVNIANKGTLLLLWYYSR